MCSILIISSVIYSVFFKYTIPFVSLEERHSKTFSQKMPIPISMILFYKQSEFLDNPIGELYLKVAAYT